MLLPARLMPETAQRVQCVQHIPASTSISTHSCLLAAARAGKLAAWMVAVNVVLEFILSVAAVAKGFSPYFCQLINQPPDAGV